MITRRTLLALLPSIAAGHARALPGPTILAAPSTASILVARAVEGGALGPDVSFAVWRSPDEMRAALVAGRTDIVTLPTNVAANLHTRGLPLRFVATLTAGHMQVITRASDIAQMSDLRGRRVQLYFRNDMPDVAFRWLLARHDLAAQRDVALDYAGSAVETMQLLLAGRATTALLNEPAASTALLAARAAGITLRRAFSLQSAWASVTGDNAALPMAGLAITRASADRDPGGIAALLTQTIAAATWMRADPAAAARLAERRFGFRADAVTLALADAEIAVEPAPAARTAIETFLGALGDISPDLIGGRLPTDDFYFPV